MNDDRPDSLVPALRRGTSLPSLLVALLLAATAHGGDLSAVDDWWYQLQGPGGTPYDVATLASGGHELVIVDLSKDGSAEGEFTSDEIDAIRAGGPDTLVIAYMSIGEASDFRFYWDELTANWSHVLASKNPKFPESRKVRYWDDDWKQFILGHDLPGTLGTGYLERVVEAGFDGVYLDIIDAYEFFGPKSAGGNGENPNAARDMIDFVDEIATHARVTLGKPGFLVIPQNGTGIIAPEQYPLADDPVIEAAAQRVRYAGIIDAIGLEDVFHLGNRDENNTPQQDDFRNAFIAELLGEGVPMFATEYLSAYRPNPKQLVFPDVVTALHAAAASFGDDHGVPGAALEIITTVRDLDRPARDPLDVPGRLYATDVVVGQDDSTSLAPGVGPGRLRKPSAVATDGTHLAVVDTSNRRVLLYDALPDADGALADTVLGQPDFESHAKGQGASGMNQPGGVCFNATQLFVADTKNHRVLVWDGWPGDDGAPADFVIGQPDLASHAKGLSATALALPTGLACDDETLLVCDTRNNRVLIFALPIDADGAEAVGVLGQSAFDERDAGSDANQLRKPTGVALRGDGLVAVADTGNHRVVLFDAIDEPLGETADAVLGQEDFGERRAAVSDRGLRAPRGVTFDAGGGLVVADASNNRLAIFDPLSLFSGALLFDVHGQTTLFSRKQGKADGLARPASVAALPDGGLLVVDQAHHRVLVMGSAVER